jgi:iron complex outermembrane recepter protein
MVFCLFKQEEKMEKKLLIILSCYVVLLCLPNDLMAGDEKSDVYVLEDIVVTGELIRPTKQTGDSLYTGTSVTKKGIELLGAPAKTSVYNALDILSGINVESYDPYGLSGTDIRIRGLKGYYNGMTVEGIPNYGIMPIGAREDIYDMENMETVSLYKGASPADLGTGSGNRGGSIELQLRRPEETAGVEVSQSVGSKDFTRTFLRVDSGELPTKTSIFGSYSYTDADKWKGKGDLGPRNHFTLGLNQKCNDRINIDLFYNFNESERHFFKSLTYEQADRIDHDDNFYHHYNNELQSDPKENVNYYDYNRGKFINRDFMSIIDINISEKSNLSLKPYYSTEDAKYREGQAGFPVVGYTQPKKPGVLDKIRDLERYGVIPEVRMDISDVGLTAGYWYESHDLEKYVRRYVTTAGGLEYNGYLYYSKNDGHGEIHSPYAKLSYKLNKFTFQAGVKYFYYEEPASTGYVSDVTLELKEDPDISLRETDYDEWLPTFGIGYELTDNARMYFNYGRNYMRPYAYVPITNTYVNMKQVFKNAGITLQDIFDDWEMETSDNFDVSFRYTHKYFSIAPVLFYSKHNDLLVSIDDPRLINPKNNKPISYYQNVGDATAYGFELELSVYPLKNLVFYFNPSYTDMSFDDDFKRGDSIVKIEDNQLPDTPEWMIKSGLIYTINNLEISPTVKWIDSRYGDALNKERIDDYTVVDLNLKYTIDDIFGLKEAKIGLELHNLFDERYVGAIVADDTGETADYYAGAPFTAVFTISGKL